jgi:hypothetical protein
MVSRFAEVPIVMLNFVARNFVQAAPNQDYKREHFLVLGLIVAMGIWLRFWGLGNVGLHGDEETMAMAAMSILHHGSPNLPSGMFYARGLIQTYLMAGSVWLFGQSEWALRFPSAIVGSGTALAAFFMGRRFLAPAYNLAFCATIALLPSMIEDSQTARMYVFFVTLLVTFAACVFRWERDQRLSSLLLAGSVWVLALLFHQLSAFAAVLFIFPGLSRRSWRQLIQGGVALVGTGLTFFVYSDWLRVHYPDVSERLAPTGTVLRTSLDVLTSGHAWLFAMTLALVTVFGVFVLLQTRSASWRRMAPPIVMILGLLAMALLQYHVGGLLLIFGVIGWLRTTGLPRLGLVVALVLGAAITVAHLWVLSRTGIYEGRQVIGALVGRPSVWPILRFLQYAPASALIVGVATLLAFVRLAQSRPVPIFFLFFAIAVWAPLLAIGFFAWYIPPRYAEGQLPYFLLCAFAAVPFLVEELRAVRLVEVVPLKIGFLALVAGVVVNPVALARAVNPEYGYYPDHKGAAEYLRALPLKSDDIVIAEDVLEQTYYLGKVDYWLRDIEDARRFSIIRNGRLVDQYTGTPVIATGAALKHVLDTRAGRNVYVIGNGESFENGRWLFREHGIAEVLESKDLEPVYLGRDGKTVVWTNRK